MHVVGVFFRCTPNQPQSAALYVRTNMEDIELEARFISQEHRVVPIWANFWLKRKEWSKDDPRRKAANTAFAMFWLPKPSSVIISGGLIALFSLYFMSKQTELLEEQNRLMDKQNRLLLSQIRDQQAVGNASRKTELIKSIYASSGEIADEVLYTKSLPATAPRIRSESIAEYLKIRRAEIDTSMEVFKATGNMPVAGATLDFGVDLRWAPLQEISINQLDMSHMSLYHSNFEAADLNYVDFSDSQIEYANLSSADLTGVNINSASLIGANLENADLSAIKWNDETIVLNANIYGIRNSPAGFKEWALRNGALEISSNDVWVKKNIQTFPSLEKHITKRFKATPSQDAL